MNAHEWPSWDVNIASPEHKADPYSLYARLRAEAPVCRIPPPHRHVPPAWLVTRYEDVAQILKDERFAKNRANALTAEQVAKQPWLPAFVKPLMRNMVEQDAPDHGRLRALVSKAFVPGIIERLRGPMQSFTDGLLSEAQRRGSLDVLRDYAVPIPTMIIGDMLGVPAADRRKFNRWSSAITSSNSRRLGFVWGLTNLWFFVRYIRQLVRYIRQLVRFRKSNPGDDLLSALAQVEEAGEGLSEDELLGMVFLLLVAGHETTVNLIGNGVLALLRHPDQLQRLRDDPALIKPAVEELLRYDSPLETATERFTREDVTVAGVTIPRGSLVWAVLASANRDERQFPDPDRLDITRDPNRHLAFGLGPTTASGRRWPAWRGRSPSARSCGGPRSSGRPWSRPRCAALARRPGAPRPAVTADHRRPLGLSGSVTSSAARGCASSPRSGRSTSRPGRRSSVGRSRGRRCCRRAARLARRLPSGR